jgi:peroxiredoxin
MIRVKTFTNELKALHAMEELHELDDQVNRFIESNNVKNVVSVSDTCTTREGNAIGIIRILTYEAS